MSTLVGIPQAEQTRVTSQHTTQEHQSHGLDIRQRPVNEHRSSMDGSSPSERGTILAIFVFLLTRFVNGGHRRNIGKSRLSHASCYLAWLHFLFHHFGRIMREDLH